MIKVDTENNSPDTEINEEQTETKRLGDLLKSYRESAGLDYEQAADALCLTVGTLKALENEEFERLPEAPYLRGYLRGYAKLANTSSAEAIALYEEIRGGNSINHTHYNFSASASVNNVIKPVIPPYLAKLVVAAVAVLLLATLSMIPSVKNWATEIWSEFSHKTQEAELKKSNASKLIATEQSTQQKVEVAKSTANSVTDIKTDNLHSEQPQELTKNTDNSNNTQQSTATIVNTTDVNNQPTQVNNSSLMEGVIQRSSDTNGDVKDITETDNSIQSTIKNTAEGDQNTADTHQAVDNAEQTNNTTKLVDNAQLQTSDNNIEQTQKIPPETTEVDLSNVNDNAGEVIVKLVFKDEVWMRVNSGKKKVFSGLKKSGESAEFKARKPLSFKVGNAPGVDVYINGKLYDQKPYMRGVVAKFKIDKE